MTGDEKTFKDFENVDKFRKEVINPIFPKADFASCFMVSSPEELATDFNGKLSPINLFKDTDYEYKGDGKFLHYTTLFGIKSILETGFLRMSEFGNLIDKNELQYAAEIFNNNPIFQIKKEDLELLKENIFCFSMCESESNDETKCDPFMWEIYGDKGKGVVIEFELTKNNPKHFLLGKVQYGEKKLQNLRELKKNAENFKKKNDEFFPNNFQQLFMEIKSFHKSKRYDAEKEVRLFLKTDKCQYEEHKRESIYKDINSNQEVKYFNKLFLKGRYPYAEDEIKPNKYDISIYDEFPQIEIKNIIIGFNISIENKVAITDLLNEIKAKHNYEFEVLQINNEKEIINMR